MALPKKFLSILKRVITQPISVSEINPLVLKLREFDKSVSVSDYKLAIIRLLGYPTEASLSLLNRNQTKDIRKRPPMVDDSVLSEIWTAYDY